MRGMFQDGWFTGYIYSVFFPQKKPKTLWPAPTSMMEAITRRIPSSFTDEPLYASALEYERGE
eukprot:3450152-Prorocentrum_lima.AAC.1